MDPILDPDNNYNIDCYPDVDFAGLFGREHSQDPHCVRCRTGYIIRLAGCPVPWVNKLRTEIALLTMESEYIALSIPCKDLLPIVDLAKEIRRIFGLLVGDLSNIHLRVHEDNVGVLTLSNLESRLVTPCSKHYAIKYHWFCEKNTDKEY